LTTQGGGAYLSASVRNVRITLALGTALLLAVGAFVLTRSPTRVLAVNGPRASSPLISSAGDLSICQRHETLPAGTRAIRLSMWAFFGWKIHVTVYSGARVITEGARGPNWTSTEVTVPVRPLGETASDATLCFATGPNSEPEQILGNPAPESRAATLFEPGVPAVRARTLGSLPGRVGAEYLASSSGSWWSQILAVARRMGLGRSFAGTWISLLAALLMVGVGVLAVRLTLREIP
jgi:hypothetical protein